VLALALAKIFVGACATNVGWLLQLAQYAPHKTPPKPANHSGFFRFGGRISDFAMLVITCQATSLQLWASCQATSFQLWASSTILRSPAGGDELSSQSRFYSVGICQLQIAITKMKTVPMNLRSK